MIDDTIKKDINETEEKPAVVETVKEPDVVDVDLGFVERKRFRINGDYSRMLELNVSDMNIFSRMKTGYPKLKTLVKEAQEKVQSIPDDLEDTEATLGAMADCLEDIDKKMRDLIDYIFDSNVSEICAPSGNMYDPVGGEWRFERIIDKISTLYANGLHAEFNKMKNRVETKTGKYTKKKK